MTPVEIIHDDISVSKSMMAHSLWLIMWKPEKFALSIRSFVTRQKIKKTKKNIKNWSNRRVLIRISGSG